MNTHDGRMNWIRNLETLDGVVERRPIDVELASEANIHGLLAYSGEALLVAPLTFQADASGLHKYQMRMQVPSTPYVFRPGSKKGYLFRDGPVGELVALLSLHFQARFFVHSIVDGQLTAHSLASKTEYAPIRATFGRSIDPTVFGARDRTFAKGLAEFGTCQRF